MDLICPKCSEPWEVDSLHEADFGLSFSNARRLFFTEGCGAVFEGVVCEPTHTLIGDASAVLYDLLGDDVDGIASSLDDFAFLGLFDNDNEEYI